MRSMQLKNNTYQQLETGFTQWLNLLQYHPTTIRDSPVKVREFLHWLESHRIKGIAQITGKALTNYMGYLSQRKNQKRSGGLSAGHLNKHINSLKQFSEYLQQSREQGFEVSLPYYTSIYQREILNIQQVKAMYEATTSDMLGMRDRAILGIYYGCGLRRAEGVALDVNDFLTERKLLYVRKGKNYRERYVPVAGRAFDDLMEYVQLGRPCFDPRSEALLLGRHRKRMSGSLPYTSVLKLKEKASITQQIGLHTLRHSIATHLLQQGMKLSDISRFLGHQSIETTQIYTHVSYEASAK